MAKQHLKRIATPRTWDIPRKQHKFITRLSPGAHSHTHATSLNTLIKELLGLASTTKEVKRILKEQEVMVDGKRRYDERFNVGFMDVITFPHIKQSYRIGFTNKGKLAAFIIPSKEANLKISRVNGKMTSKGGKVHYRMSDGRAIITDKPEYAIGDSLLLEVPGQAVKQRLELKTGAEVIVYKGKYNGTKGSLQEIDAHSVVIKIKDDIIHTKRSYVFVVGDQKPIITCAP